MNHLDRRSLLLTDRLKPVRRDVVESGVEFARILNRAQIQYWIEQKLAEDSSKFLTTHATGPEGAFERNRRTTTTVVDRGSLGSGPTAQNVQV